MHRINAKVARADPAHNRVEVRAVTIEIPARRVDQVGNFPDVGLEQAARIRIGQHDAGNVVGILEFCLQLVHVDPAAGIGLDLVDHEAALHGGRGICAMGRSRNQHALARFALAAGNQRLTDRHHAAEFTMGPGLGAHRDGGHAGQRLQPCRQFVDQFQRALHRGLRLQGVNVRKARQAGQLFIQPRIVFHRAAAQREQAKINGIILLRQAHVVAHGLRLRQARQAGRNLAGDTAQAAGTVFRRWQVNTGRVFGADLEDQALGLQQATRPRYGLHGRVCRLGRRCRAALRVHGHQMISFSAAA